MSLHNHSALWKQFLGATIGGSIALALYGVYSFASPHVASLAAVLVTPQARIGIDASAVRTAETGISEQELLRIASRAQQIAQQSGGVSPDVQSVPVGEEQIATIVPHPVVVQESKGQSIENTHIATATANAWHADSVSAIQEPVFYAQGSQLASAGLGLWIAILGAVAGAALCLRRRIAACVLQNILR